jgi:hypothetical protein
VGFRVPVTCTESLDVSAVKRLEVQVVPSLAGVSGASVHRPAQDSCAWQALG